MKRHVHKKDDFLRIDLKFRGKRFGRIISFSKKSDMAVLVPHIFDSWGKSVAKIIEETNGTKTESNTD